MIKGFINKNYQKCKERPPEESQNLKCPDTKYILLFLFPLFGFTYLNAQENWTTELPTVGSFSSIRVADLNQDGVKDIVMGAGRAEFQNCDSAVVALDGKDGQLLWKVAAKDQIFGSANFLDINQDGIKDVFIGGRSAELMAINGANGQVFWRFLEVIANCKLDTTSWFNFYNPQFIPDVDGDVLPDILVANGGDVMVEPYDPNRPPGYLVVISSKTGKLLAKAVMPDRKEIYMSPLIAETPKGLVVLYGTGGETVGGNLFISPLKDILEEDLSTAIILDSSSDKGYIGPPASVDLNQDSISDFVVNTVNGRLLAFDGKDNSQLWEVELPSAESYSSVAIGYFTEDEIPDIFVSFGSGIWPHLDWSIQLMVNGQNGQIAYKDSLGFYQNTTPIVADLNGDGREEIIMSLNYQGVNEVYQKFFYTTLIAIEFGNKEIVHIAPKLEGNNLSSTPWIGDLDNNGFLDILFCHGTNLRHTYTFDGMLVHKLVTQIPVYKPIIWGAYQGSHYNGIWRDHRNLGLQPE